MEFHKLVMNWPISVRAQQTLEMSDIIMIKLIFHALHNELIEIEDLMMHLGSHQDKTCADSNFSLILE